MKTDIWFEIGFNNINGETETVFHDTLLSECIIYWTQNEYNKDDYFIDIWENENDCTPVPIGNVDLKSCGL